MSEINLTEQTENTTSTGFSFEQYLESNKKQVLTAAGIAAVLVLGVVYFFFGYLPQQNQEAQKMMFKAESAFAKDSFQLALNGNVSQKGFKQIAADFGMTRAGKLANYYAGLCCLQLKKWDDAVNHLNDFSTNDPLLKAVSLSALGDAYMEKGDKDKGVSYYEKAASSTNSDEMKPFFLQKAALAHMYLNHKEDAVSLFKQLKTDYPRSNEGRDAEKYIYLLDPAAAN